ncbi:MAG: polysaccharide biosynthesis/export family protein, partial [Rikenellaceae bacterium]
IDYVVDEKGSIDFPVLGEIEVLNLTCRELEEDIKKKLEPYLVEPPVVSVTMTNFKISVLGEVASPGVQLISSAKVNIYEALAMAGDLTIYGQRNNVKLVREGKDGDRKVITIDLNDANLVTSEYYYLTQNDVVYVAPNKPKGNTSAISSSTTIWITFVSTFMSIASFVMALTL